MAAYIKKNFLLALMVLSLLVVSSYARFDMKVTKGDIDSICTKEDVNRSLCFEILKPTPEITKLDFSGLAKFLINYQTRNTSDTLKQIKMFEGNTTGADLNSVQLCEEMYDDSLFHNDLALKVLATKDYDSLNTEVGFTLAYMDTCNDALSTMKPVSLAYVQSRLSASTPLVAVSRLNAIARSTQAPAVPLTTSMANSNLSPLDRAKSQTPPPNLPSSKYYHHNGVLLDQEPDLLPSNIKPPDFFVHDAILAKRLELSIISMAIVPTSFVSILLHPNYSVLGCCIMGQAQLKKLP